MRPSAQQMCKRSVYHFAMHKFVVALSRQCMPAYPTYILNIVDTMKPFHQLKGTLAEHILTLDISHHCRLQSRPTIQG